MKARRALLVPLFAFALMTSCGADDGALASASPSRRASSLDVSLLVAVPRHIATDASADPARIRSVHLTLQDGSGVRGTRKWIDLDSSSAAEFDDVPAGEYTVSAYALDDEDGPILGHTVCSTSSQVRLAPNSRADTILVLQQDVEPGPENATSPFIHSVTASGLPPVIDRPIRLTADVRGSPSQSFRWEVSCADDSTPLAPFTNPTSLTTDLTLHRCSGDATITFFVANRDGANRALTSSVRFTLPYAPQGVSVSGISLNSWPNITSIATPSNAAPVPGGTVDLIATAADPDGDRLVYSWSDDCGGGFVRGDTPSPTWTAPAVPGAVCELKLTVREAGNGDGHNSGSNAGTFTLRVAPSIG